MSYKQLSDMPTQRQKELKRQYRNPPTRLYQILRVVRISCLLAALVCAYFASPLSSVPEEYRLIFVVIGNVLVVGAIVLDATKMRTLREEYIEEVLNSNSKENRKAQKAARAEKRTKTQQEVSLEDKLADNSLSYWDRLKISAQLSAQEARKNPREK